MIGGDVSAPVGGSCFGGLPMKGGNVQSTNVDCVVSIIINVDRTILQLVFLNHFEERGRQG